MDLGQIKYAALGPHRWAQKLQSHHECTEHNRSARIIYENRAASELPLLPPAHVYTIDSLSRVYRQQQFLIPGGRFLIDANSSAVRLLDLGVPGLPALASPRLVSAFDLTEPGFELSQITVVPIDDRRLRLALIMEDGDLIVKILEISPAEENAAFEQVAFLHLKTDARLAIDLSLHRNLVMMRLKKSGGLNLGLIWDFFKKQYIILESWEDGDVGASFPSSTFEWSADKDLQLSLIGNAVVQVNRRRFTAWPITSDSWNRFPSMATLPIVFERLQITREDRLPAHTPIPYDFQPSTITTAFRSANWYTNNDDRLVVDALYENRSEGSLLRNTGHQYEIEGSKEYPYIRMKKIATFTLSAPYRYSSVCHDGGRVALGLTSWSWMRLRFGRIWSQICLYSILPATQTERQFDTNLHDDLANAVVTAIYDGNLDGGCKQVLCTAAGRMVSSIEDADVINLTDYLSYHPTTVPSTPTRLEMKLLERELRLGERTCFEGGTNPTLSGD